MILRLLLGAGIGSGVSWYLGRRDQRSLVHSAGIGAGAMLLSPLLADKAGNLAGDKGAWYDLPASWTDPAPAAAAKIAGPQSAGGAGSTGFYKDEGGYAWYYDYNQKAISMMSRPGGGARSVIKKAEQPDLYMKVWTAAIKGKTPTDRETVLAYAASKGGMGTGKAGAAQTAAKAPTRASVPSVADAAAPPVEPDLVDKAAAMVGATRTQLYIGAGVLVVGVGAALYFSSRPARPALALTARP